MTLALIRQGEIIVIPEDPSEMDYSVDLSNPDPAVLASRGILEILEVPKPDDTATTTHDKSIELVSGIPTEVWTERPMTAAEIEAATYPSVEQSLLKAARLTVVPQVISGTIPEAEMVEYAGLFPPWAVGLEVSVGEVYRWDGTLVEALQAHTTQSDWTPDIVPALFKIHRAVGSVAAWVQPTGAHDAYALGERVTFKGATYESVIDANVWSPTAYPAGWTLIA